MVPADLNAFLIACLGASASFIGLLFVGLSIVLQNTKSDKRLADTDRLLAESSFVGFINIFFVCLVAILPRSSIGIVSVVMALVCLIDVGHLRNLHIQRPSLFISGAVYLAQLGFGIYYVLHKSHSINESLFVGIIIALFAISLVRAWGLTGINPEK